MKDNNLINGPSLNSKTGNINQLLIFLHGWGSNGDDLIQLAPFFSNEFPNAFFLSPNGPEICPENPLGGRQWISLSFQKDGKLDKSDTPKKLSDAAVHVNKFIDNWQTRYNIPGSHTYLFGFSQGSMVALEVGLKRKIGGILCYSGSFINSLTTLTYKPKIMLIHGEFDEVIPIDIMIKAELELKEIGADVSIFECKGLGHSINETGINKGIEFIKKCENL